MQKLATKVRGVSGPLGDLEGRPLPLLALGLAAEELAMEASAEEGHRWVLDLAGLS